MRDAAERWTSPFDGVDRLLVMLARRRRGILGPFELQTGLDFPLVCARGPDELDELFELAGRLGYVKEDPGVFTVSGLRHLDELRKRAPDSRQAFVAMWFDPSMNEAWADGFKPAIEASAFFNAVRVDSIQHNDKIDDRIVAEIRRSAIMVADFTGQRGGVYYEAGFAQGLGLPVIWTCRADWIDKLHFDTRQYNHIEWREPQDLREALALRLAATQPLRIAAG